MKAGILSRFFERPAEGSGHLPRPFGVFYENNRSCYEVGLNQQVEEAIAKKGLCKYHRKSFSILPEKAF